MTLELNQNYWNSRYLNNEIGWDIGEPSTPLKEYIDQLTNKELRVLIPGAGNAYEAEYLVNKGFKHVYVCDISEMALNNLMSRCPSINKHHLLHSDFFNIESLKFDLILEQTFFCAISPTFRKQYFEKMHQLLDQNGALVGVLFNDVLNVDKPPFGGNSNEYRTYFDHLFNVKVFETCYNSIAPRAERELFMHLSPINS